MYCLNAAGLLNSASTCCSNCARTPTSLDCSQTVHVIEMLTMRSLALNLTSFAKTQLNALNLLIRKPSLPLIVTRTRNQKV